MTNAKVAATFGEHRCHALRCTEPVPPKMLMCKTHWYMVPPALRKAVWTYYRPGQEIDKNPSEEYVKWANKAVQAVADKEGIPRV